MADYIVWQPNPGPQTEFLSCSAYEALYGGAAGGGKSAAMLAAPLRWVHLPSFNGIIFRRTFPELEGQIIPKSRELYRHAGATYNSVQHTWTFPSGARVSFGHLQHDSDVYKFQGMEFQFIGFDELTQFTERQYTYLLTRARSAHGIPIRVRSTSNPGGEGHEWVFKRWGPWLDRDYSGVRALPGQVLHHTHNGDTEEPCEPNTSGALSRVFIPAKVTDNPHLMDNDPGYIDRLSAQDRVTRAQLRDGDWMIRPGAGAYFKRQWFQFIDSAPIGPVDRVRAWDLASVEGGGDWTVGVRMAKQHDGRIVIEDVVRLRSRPDGVRQAVLSTAQIDGYSVKIRMPQDPGQAGKDQVASYSKMLAGYVTHFKPVTGDKIIRCQPFSAYAEAGNISIVKAPWNEPFMQSLEAFPDEGVHDDDVDAASDAFTMLARGAASMGTTDWKGPTTAFGAPPPKPSTGFALWTDDD